MEKVEHFLIDEISASTVCKLTNHSILTNSMKLKTECMKFLMDSFASKTALKNIEILDKDVGMEILRDSQYQTVTIQ
uniref:Uncharacterized protein n=1 Tax=Panagrolaimus davidi TaxID=227884 RepID=A0A914Q2D6_9BILA